MATEWLSRILEVLKLPLKYMWVAVVVSGFLLFGPMAWLDRVGVTAFKSSHNQIIGITFLISAVIVTVNLLEAIYRNLSRRRRRHKLIAGMLKELEELDPMEKAILREYFIQNQDTIQLPVDQANIAGLIRKGILVPVGSIGERSRAGCLFPVAMRKEIKEFLSPDHLDLPDIPDEKLIQQIVDQRPDFVQEIQRHNAVFHTSWMHRNRRGYF